MANRDFDRGARPWGYDEPYFRGGYAGAGYGYREPGYGGSYYGREPAYGGGYTSYYGRESGRGAYGGDYIREGGPGAYGGSGYYGGYYSGGTPYYGRERGYGGGYPGREPYDPYDRERFDRENYGSGYGDAYGRGSYAGRWGRETGRESYFGRGPRGYRRSDERIREEINDRLTWHPDIDAMDIEVRVENGEVTLTGVVEDRRAKRLAADIADEVFGVQDVHNQLKVRHGFLAGLTGEKAEEREVSRTAESEGSEGPARRGTRTGATAAGMGSATTETGRRGT